jgi:hypothetical protein
MPEFHKGIVTVRFRHPSEKGELEVRINAVDDAADVVFISVDAVDKILIPTYQRTNPADAADLRQRVELQRRGDNCVVLHKYSCMYAVPPIDWSKSTIKLGPCDWRPTEPKPAR